MERGVIISPYFTFDGRTLNFPGLVGIEKDLLRHFLLYWDKIEYPTNNRLHLASSPEDQFLMDAGVMQRTEINLRGFSGNIGIAYILSQAIATRQLNEAESGKWTIAQSGSQLFLPNDLSSPVKSLEIELYNALPSPSPDVSLEDIIAFKKRYSDELIALRAHIDELYLEICKSGDIPRAKTIAIQRLEKSISDIDRAATESWISKLASGFKIEFNLPTILEKVAAGAFVAELIGLSSVLGAVVGVVSAAIKFNLSVGPKIDGTPNDFAYLSHINKKLRR